MTNQPLSIHAKCRGSEKCIFDGGDLFIEIAIVNRGVVPVGFPLALRKKSGPSIRLFDVHTKAESTLRTNLANPELAKELTSIPPGRSTTLEWVIKRSEIEPFAKPNVDLAAEITVACRIQVNGKMEDFRGTDILPITGK